MNFLLLVAASFLFAVGGLFMKYSLGLTRLGPTVVVLLLFCMGAACQTVAMKHEEMGVTYVVVLGLEAVVAFALSIGVLGESLSPPKLGAVLLILAGIALLKWV
ncbi:SMR family transporter [Pendulispora brunnea]|uniref:Guanidinium exporter n=1 Tax=Pendulispora brunnea TaxID=2905690 RepID=A0ABZ2KA23_9BACT